MKKLFILIFSVTALSLSSCLKDNPNTDFSSIKNAVVLELPWAGLQYFAQDAITDNSDTIVKSFGINIASVNPLSTDTKYTIALDYSLMDSYNKANTAVSYEQMPAGSYKISKLSGTIKAGARLDSVTVTFYKNKLDPSKSYMLPIKLVSTSNGILSGNFNAHYYHFIGNDFAGTYDLISSRWNAADTTTTTPAYYKQDFGTVIMSPVTPSSMKVQSGYYNGIPYTISFTKTGSGASATYSNFTVGLSSDDIAKYWTPVGVTLGSGPNFDPDVDPTKQYTYAEAVKLFRFYYTTASRAIIDQYIKQ